MPSGLSLPEGLLSRLGLALLTGELRSFRTDATRCISRLQPPLKIYGTENIPQSGPGLVTTNHYTRPGLRAWWLALAVSSAVPAEIHWLITSAWTYPDRLRSATITPLSRWILKRLAQIYHFTAMPPMPPNPAETLERAAAVRRVLRYARLNERPLIGLAPEGGDFRRTRASWPSLQQDRAVLSPIYVSWGWIFTRWGYSKRTGVCACVLEQDTH